MRKRLSYIIVLFQCILISHILTAQVRVVDNKGTVMTIDSSYWIRTGVNNNICTKYSGNVGIASNLPGASLHNGGSTILGMTSVSNTATAYVVPVASVDDYSGVVITQTGSAATVTLSSPSNATPGRRFILTNASVSTFPLIVGSNTLPIAASGEFVWNGSAWSAPSTVSSLVPLSGLTAATNTAGISNGDFAQTWSWNASTAINPFTIGSNSLTTGNLFTVANTSASQTANAFLVSSTATAPTSGITHFNYSASHTGNGFQLDDATTAGGNVMVINANSLTSGNALSINVNTLTTGTGVLISSTGTDLTTGSLLAVSGQIPATTITNGLFSVRNTAASSAGTVASIQANTTLGSGLTVLANGNIGIGKVAPTASLHIAGSVTGVAGTASLKMDAGVVSSAVIDQGVIERDANVFYATPNSVSRGVLPAVSYTIINNPYTLGAVAANTAFGVFPSGQAAITVAANTTYEFEAVYYITYAGSHVTSSLFGGTATISSMRYRAQLTAGTASGIVTAISTTNVNSSAVKALNAAANVAETVIELHGIIRVGATSGTLIPQLRSSTAATTGTITIQQNSFFKLTPIGNNMITTIGNWQ